MFQACNVVFGSSIWDNDAIRHVSSGKGSDTAGRFLVGLPVISSSRRFLLPADDPDGRPRFASFDAQSATATRVLNSCSGIDLPPETTEIYLLYRSHICVNHAHVNEVEKKQSAIPFFRSDTNSIQSNQGVNQVDPSHVFVVHCDDVWALD